MRIPIGAGSRDVAVAAGAVVASPVASNPYAGAMRRVLPLFLWGVFPVLFTGLALITEARLHKFTGDFYYAFWPAGHAVLHGVTPYVDPSSPLIARSAAFVYPAVAALLMAPFALLPRVAGDELFTALNIGAVLLALRVLSVRDWRLYGAALLWPAVFAGWYTSNVTLLLVLGVAVAWRFRDRAAVCGLTVALVVSLKIFLWPLALWLLATRRYAAAAYAAAGGLVVNAIAWATLGFGELHRYTQLLHALTSIEGRRGYSVTALAMRGGLDHAAAYALAVVLAAGLAAACLIAGRRHRDANALLLALAVALLATPLLWLHYFALLLVPLAILRPRLGPLWLVPMLTWFYPPVRPHGWEVVVALAVAAIVVVGAARAPERPRLGVAT